MVLKTLFILDIKQVTNGVQSLSLLWGLYGYCYTPHWFLRRGRTSGGLWYNSNKFRIVEFINGKSFNIC